MTQRSWRRSFEAVEERETAGRTLGWLLWIGAGARLGFGWDSWDWRTIAAEELASTFRSEKSFEVSSANLRNSGVSSVARLHKSNPTRTKKMTLGRIFGSAKTGKLYSKGMLNSRGYGEVAP